MAHIFTQLLSFSVTYIFAPKCVQFPKTQRCIMIVQMIFVIYMAKKTIQFNGISTVKKKKKKQYTKISVC